MIFRVSMKNGWARLGAASLVLVTCPFLLFNFNQQQSPQAPEFIENLVNYMYSTESTLLNSILLSLLYITLLSSTLRFLTQMSFSLLSTTLLISTLSYTYSTIFNANEFYSIKTLMFHIL